jgi:hypothetical protein
VRGPEVSRATDHCCSDLYCLMTLILRQLFHRDEVLSVLLETVTDLGTTVVDRFQNRSPFAEHNR